MGACTRTDTVTITTHDLVRGISVTVGVPSVLSCCLPTYPCKAYAVIGICSGPVARPETTERGWQRHSTPGRASRRPPDGPTAPQVCSPHIHTFSHAKTPPMQQNWSKRDRRGCAMPMPGWLGLFARRPPLSKLASTPQAGHCRSIPPVPCTRLCTGSDSLLVVTPWQRHDCGEKTLLILT